jgi:hypothetical protein
MRHKQRKDHNQYSSGHLMMISQESGPHIIKFKGTLPFYVNLICYILVAHPLIFRVSAKKGTDLFFLKVTTPFALLCSRASQISLDKKNK